jgi:hypothetical protein
MQVETPDRRVRDAALHAVAVRQDERGDRPQIAFGRVEDVTGRLFARQVGLDRHGAGAEAFELGAKRLDVFGPASPGHRAVVGAPERQGHIPARPGQGPGDGSADADRAAGTRDDGHWTL